MPIECKICSAESVPAFDGRILGKYQIGYFRCTRCGFMQTEAPFWLAESYSDAIADVDLGPINRAMTGAGIVENLILIALEPNARYLDWGGGYGLFTRLMRDHGYDFYWHDRYCDNLFARQFVATEGEQYELITAFEVFEHLVDPVAEVTEMIARSRNIFFTSLLVPADVDPSWWYLAPETGQHIAFYTPAALKVLADRFGLHLCSDGHDKHFLSEKPVSERAFRAAVRNARTARLVRRVLRRHHHKGSLLESDFRRITGWKV